MEDICVKDDSDLIERCIGKDTAAWDILVRKYTGLIYAAITNRAGKYSISLPRHDVEDIAQGVLISIWENSKLASVKNRKDISCWLAVVSGNYALRYLRKRGDKEVLCEECYEEAIASRDEETASEIEKIMDDMPPKEKLVIELNLFHDKKYREIADMLDMPLATVSSHIKRAKAKLKISLTNL